MNGPSEAEALLSFALGSSSAERPSTSRRLTSLPSIAPTMRPVEDTARATSGSGLFHDETCATPISDPHPTAERTGALVKTSGSGPNPTSRYWDHWPRALRSSLRRAASSLPGSMEDRVEPMSRSKSPRMASACSGSPPARSSMSRSSSDVANVTPAA